jgi:hypothetical protein
MLAKKGLMTSPSAVALYIEDAFSTYLYTGTGSAQTITNNIDLSGEGGLVWIKGRSGATGHRFTDTVRGATKSLASNSTAAEATESTGLTAFSGTGFTIGADADYNTNAATYCSWTFRKAEKFFDVVTYIGNGSNRTISHNLGSVPGCIIVKRTDTTGDWQVYHRANTANPETDYLVLNTTAATADSDTRWNDTLPTSTVFSLGTDATVNANSGTYVAYLFAHDAGGFGEAGDQSVIKCGSYTGNGSTTGPTIDLGWEPQWVLIKQSTQSGNRWTVTDNMRGFPVYSTANQQILQPHNTDAEVGVMYFQPTATGFKVVDVDADVNSSGETYIYIAIRRGPMKTPEAGTDVHSAVTWTGNNAARNITGFGFPLDMAIARVRNDAGASRYGITFDRVRGIVSSASGARILQTTSTNAEATYSSINGIDLMTGFKIADGDRSINDAGTPNTYVAWGFKRAPGFFDVVAYTGTGSATTVTHNLGVAPELLIVKSRSNAQAWGVLTTLNSGLQGRLNETSAFSSPSSAVWGSGGSYVAPTSTVFTVGTDNETNGSGYTYVAYLFASVSGVSKVGSYTGNGSNQTINCGFTTGARFVLIKRTDGTGDWYIYDSARGIDSGSDPQIKLNTTSAEATGYDAVDPDNSGFIVNNDGTNFPINANGVTYIYLAIA